MDGKKVFLFDEPVTEVIKRRESIRTYSGTAVPQDIKEKINRYFSELEGPFSTGVRFILLDRDDIKAGEGIKLGTYGMIAGARTFIAAAVINDEHSMEQTGYVFEKLILYITSLGLGTCWIAGTFNRDRFAKAVKMEEGEILPVVTPIGYAGKVRSVVDIAIKQPWRAKKRKEWGELFFKDGFETTLNEAEAGAYSVPLEMVRLAPSASNKQPWRIIMDKGGFHFFLARSQHYRNLLGFDIQKIDMGIAMFHFESTAKESGLPGKWEINNPRLKGVPDNTEYIITWRKS